MQTIIHILEPEVARQPNASADHPHKISEDDKEYLIKAELPELKKEDVKIA